MEVKDNKINIELPENFSSTNVDIIIFPENEEDLFLSAEGKELMRNQVKNTDSTEFKDWR